MYAISFTHRISHTCLPFLVFQLQALASYVFIAANVMLHAQGAVEFRHLDELFPPIIPFLTSHHHSLRGFTQVSSVR